MKIKMEKSGLMPISMFNVLAVYGKVIAVH